MPRQLSLLQEHTTKELCALQSTPSVTPTLAAVCVPCQITGTEIFCKETGKSGSQCVLDLRRSAGPSPFVPFHERRAPFSKNLLLTIKRPASIFLLLYCTGGFQALSTFWFSASDAWASNSTHVILKSDTGVPSRLSQHLSVFLLVCGVCVRVPMTMATRRRPKLSLVLKCDAGPSCCNIKTGKENVVTLNPRLWEKLPENLLEQILAKLPFSALIRFCCVCKKWKNLFLSNEVSSRCNSSKPVLVHSLAGPLTVYSPSRGAWEKLLVNYLPIDVSQLSLVASATGLLCFSTDSFGEFVICNPLTKKCRRLQMPCGDGQGCVMPVPSPLHLNRDESGMNCMIRLGYLRVGMVYNNDTGFYKLVVASIYEGSGRTTLVYDSSSGSWKKVAMVPQGRFFRMKAISCSGNLYCGITGVESGVGGESGGFAKLVRYDAEKESWSAILIPAHLGFPRKLVEHRDRLLLLARPNWQISETFDFFELQEAGNKMWLAAKYMPRRLMDSVYAAMSRPNNPILRSYIKCFGHGDIMYFVGICVKRAEADPLMRACSRSITGLRVWTHDFSTNSCLRLSDWEDWDLDNGPLSYHLLSPSLNAQV